MLSRRKFLSVSAFAMAGARTLYGQPATGSVDVDVRVKQGTLRGEALDGVNVFRGVPFAQPPVGSLRFRQPQPLQPWTGVHEAKRFAAAALQPGQSGVEQSEDCLYLNIWSPQPSHAPRPGVLCPVLVWIHGGGFTGGRSFDPLFDGSEFARAGMVVVTVAYRLGALGFLDVSPLLGPEFAGSGDNALRDLIAALQWVSANIEVFGGNPGRVTLGGESAGAKLTDLLTGIPSAAPLFQQMISESGGAERIWAVPQAQEIGSGFGKRWTQQTQLPVSALRAAPGRQIVDLQDDFVRNWPVHFPFRPELDPRLAPVTPLKAIRDGSSRKKRLLLGTNRDESAFFLGPHPKQAPGAQDLGNMQLDRFDEIAARYQAIYPEMSEEMRRIRSVSAEEYWIPSLRVAEAHTSAGGEAWVYRLDFPGTGRFAGLAFHSYDLQFVWDRFGSDVPTAAARALAAEMHAAWVAFIKGETPQAAALPPWPRYTLDQRPTMILDEPSRVELDPSGAERKLWNGLLMN